MTEDLLKQSNDLISKISRVESMIYELKEDLKILEDYSNYNSRHVTFAKNFIVRKSIFSRNSYNERTISWTISMPTIIVGKQAILNARENELLELQLKFKNLK